MSKKDDLLREIARVIKQQPVAPRTSSLLADDTAGRILAAFAPWARWYALATLITLESLVVLAILSAIAHGGSWTGANAWLARAHVSVWHLTWFSAGFACLLLAFRRTFLTPPRFRPRR